MNSNHSQFHLLGLIWPLCLGLALGACGQDATIGEDESLIEMTGAALIATPDDPVVAFKDDLTVITPDRFNVPYAGAAQAEFPSGLPLSVGSGIRFRRNGPGLSFYGLTDRGPTADSPSYLDGSGVSRITKGLPAPAFAPEILTIGLSWFGPIVTSALPIKSGGTKVSGIAPAALSAEVALTEALAALPPSETGIDPEGIDVDARGNLWLCEEMGPSLVKVHSRSGEILTKLTPGAGLPAVLAGRQNNRGFEGVTVAPNGKVYAMVQSTLDIAGGTKSKAQFIRLVEYDPSNGATRMFAYPHDIAEYAKSGDAKMGDLAAVDNHRLVTIEQGKDKNKALRNLVYGIDINGATDLTGLTLTSGPNAGKDLEYGTAAEIATQITMVRKSLVVDLRAQGWTDEKSEGLSLVDARTLVIANDQDFGVTATMSGDATSTDPAAYVVDSDGVLTINGASSIGHYEIHAAPVETQRSHLFVIRLRQPVATYCPQ